MKTLDIEIALMQYLNIRQNIVVPNISWGLAGLHECDILSLSKSNYATEIEIKTSKHDLLKDKEKLHNHMHNHISYFYYAVPEKLKELALQSIPERAGLFVIKYIGDNSLSLKYGVYLTKQCTLNKNAVKWSEKERYQLTRLGTMRILKLKEKINKANQITNLKNETKS